MTENRPQQIKPNHLQKLAIVYVRQSTMKQVLEHTGSTSYQRGQKEFAFRWGWPEQNIEIVDVDLGRSGTRGENREGWQRILKLVAQQLVGIILASFSSRLTRSSKDFEVLLELCRATETLLAVDGAIIDANDSSNRLLARLRANVAEYENELRTETFMKARLKKAREGFAVTGWPTGFIGAQKGKWVKDPDTRVREMIEQVFTQYEALGTARGVLTSFVRHRLQLPIRRGDQELHWVRPTLERIHGILTNPAYAGYYVYGQRPKIYGASGDQRRRTTWDDWIVVPDHHEAYLTPAKWHRIQQQLRSNRPAVRQPAGLGPALLQGVIRCGKCGRSMRVQYYPAPRGIGYAYACLVDNLRNGGPRCWYVEGRRLDAVVAREILRDLAPPELDAVLEAAGEVNLGYEAARRQREMELMQARYEADRAKRFYKAVDPENRLSAAALEVDWERAQQKVLELERRFAAQPLEPPLQVTPEVLESIRRLTVDLPRLWEAPTTTNQDRKALLRSFVREVRVASVTPTMITIDVTWAGGTIMSHSIFPPRAGAILAHELAAAGLTEEQIALELNARGVRTVQRGGPYSASGVRSILQGARRRARLAVRQRELHHT